MKFNKCFILSLFIVSLSLVSCNRKKASIVYMPDMYYPVSYDPYQETFIAYSDAKNTVPLFIKQEGATVISPVKGTIARNQDNVLPLDLPNTAEGYDASKLIIKSFLDSTNLKSDIQKGKFLYEKTCLVCHGANGDGQGTIVQSGAYSGVPDYRDRQITVGSIYYVIENGRNAMGSYVGHLLPGDRWRIAQYIMSEFKQQ